MNDVKAYLLMSKAVSMSPTTLLQTCAARSRADCSVTAAPQATSDITAMMRPKGVTGVQSPKPTVVYTVHTNHQHSAYPKFAIHLQTGG